MKNSEIFDSFVKIAQEKGLISEGAKDSEHTEKNLDNPRWDSLSIEQIGKLYNTKADLPEDMQYKKNIIEDAHPEPVVLSPAHDKLNGLVENEQEGQNIRLRIVMKQPDGHLTQRKYARKQLLLSLVSLANELDNSDEDELRKLADVCLMQASSKKLEKRAVAPLLIVGLVLAGLGAIYLQQHIPFKSEGWNRDYQALIQSIDGMLTSNTDWGWGYSYTAQFHDTLGNLKDELAKLNTEMVKVLPILETFQKPREAHDLVVFLQSPETQANLATIEEFKRVFKEVEPFVQTLMIDLKKSMYQAQAIQGKGVLEELVDKIPFLHGGGGSLFTNVFDELSGRLSAVVQDITAVKTAIDGAENFRRTEGAQMTQDMVQRMTTPAPTTTTPTIAPTKPVAEETSEGIEGEGEGLLSSLLGA